MLIVTDSLLKVAIADLQTVLITMKPSILEPVISRTTALTRIAAAKTGRKERPAPVAMAMVMAMAREAAKEAAKEEESLLSKTR
jgi:hypothetical protein